MRLIPESSPSVMRVLQALLSHDTATFRSCSDALAVDLMAACRSLSDV
eukprot:CAMPEP_0172091648 /NCGR_PEP_ID=MMETSP1043-20130122/25016_1 /TAXON_ID=464988 /ORGANISM="Hemiselmis andersenii, Strain CCMP441" /LENGTH=47 /DNA_ID= /DNA_START= /DNA_END= /DNA_ORIENTATION=